MSHKKVPESLRERVEKRAANRCEYCKTPDELAPQRFAMECIHPHSLGGKLTFDNLALACSGCNSAKYNKTEGIDPVTNEKSRLFNPRTDIWSDHFDWDIDSINLLGMTIIGRVTVETLKLNRPRYLHVRSVLKEFNRHPPE